MRRLEELSAFSAQRAKLYRWGPGAKLAFSSSGDAVVKSAHFDCAAGAGLPLYCCFVSRSVIRGRRVHRRRGQDFLSLEFISSGELHVKSGLKGYVAEHGDVCLLRPCMDHEFFHPGSGECVVHGFILRGTKLPELMAALRLDRPLTVHLAKPAPLLELHRRLTGILKFARRNPKLLRQSSGAAYELLQLLSENVENSKFSPSMATLLDLMEERCGEPLEMRALADMLQCSLPTFNKRFVAELGVTPYQHLIKLRMVKAERLLRETPLPVKDIASRCGYMSPLHFSTEFKRLYRQTPSSFRRCIKG